MHSLTIYIQDGFAQYQCWHRIEEKLNILESDMYTLNEASVVGRKDSLVADSEHEAANYPVHPAERQDLLALDSSQLLLQNF